MKLCKDCKYMRIGLFNRLLDGYKYAKCIHPKVNKFLARYLVSGDSESYHCETERQFGNDCGHEGKLFEKK